jgi:hypothetical protein
MENYDDTKHALRICVLKRFDDRNHVCGFAFGAKKSATVRRSGHVAYFNLNL